MKEGRDGARDGKVRGRETERQMEGKLEKEGKKKMERFKIEINRVTHIERAERRTKIWGNFKSLTNNFNPGDFYYIFFCL